MRDNKDYIDLSKTMGLWNRGRYEQCPEDHLLEATNILYNRADGWRNRDGLVEDLDTSVYITGGRKITQFSFYVDSAGATHYLILDSVGNLWDPTFSTVTPILSIGLMTGFSVITIYSRAYITPHNWQTGLNGEFVYVYDGTAVARKAAGVKPVSVGLTAANSATAGNIEGGTHLLAVVYETSSGFITPPGATVAQWAATGALSLNATVIPTGPAGTVARHLLATRTLNSYNGNYKDYEFFFIPGGTINDNVTVALDPINFWDSDLVESADYLLDILEEIPASLSINELEGRLVTGGEKLYPHVARVSGSGDPETFSSLEGFLLINPTENGGNLNSIAVTNFIEQRGVWYIFKLAKTYYTQDNGGPPNTWKIELLDCALGTGILGISRVEDTKGTTSDTFLVATREGVRIFSGGYIEDNPLTWKVANYWTKPSTINFGLDYTGLKYSKVCVDPTRKLIYVIVRDYATGGTSEPAPFLVGDYSLGLNWQAIRWVTWDNGFSNIHKNISMVQGSTGIPILYTSFDAYTLAGGVNNKFIFRYDYNKVRDVIAADPTLITNFAVATSALTFSKEEAVCYFGFIRMVVRSITDYGVNPGDVTLNCYAGSGYEVLPSTLINDVPVVGRYALKAVQRPLNITGERCIIRLTWAADPSSPSQADAAGIEMSKLFVFGHETDTERPDSWT